MTIITYEGNPSPVIQKYYINSKGGGLGERSSLKGGQWFPLKGGGLGERSFLKGDLVPPPHLRAVLEWRLADLERTVRFTNPNLPFLAKNPCF